MLKLRPGTQIYLSVSAVDMRKSIDTLSALVIDEFKGDPRSGHLFLFLGRSFDKLKILYWDRNGFVLHYKRLEKHRFIVRKNAGQQHFSLTQIQLNGLLAGLDFQLMGDFDEIDYDKIF